MLRPIVLLAALGLSGCGTSSPPMAGTPDSSRAALVEALDGWKEGKTYQQLAEQSPSINVVDDDLNRGTTLLDYKIEGEGQPSGTGYSYVVTLTLKDPSGGATRTRKVAYKAVTEPKRAVTREDR
jgi:hypothetical protein